MHRLVFLALATCAACCARAADEPYLEFTGQRPMNLRNFMGPKTKIAVDYAFTDFDTRKQQRVFGIKWHHGVYNNGSGNVTFQSCEGLTTTGDKKNAFGKSDTNRHLAVIDVPNKQHLYITGTTTNSASFTNPTTATTDCPIFLAGASNGTDGETYVISGKPTTETYNAKVRVYGVKIWEDGALVHDYSPARIDGYDGLKDAVDGVFLPAGKMADGGYNATLGGSAAIESRPGLAYLEANGHQGITTDYVVTPKTRLEFDFATTEKQANTRLANAGNSSSGLYLDFYTSSSYGITFFTHDAAGGWSKTQALGAHSSALPMTTNLYVRRTYVVDWKNATFKLKTAGYENQSFAITKPPTLSANDPLTFLRGSSTQMAKGRFYGAKVYEDDVLAANYVPAIKDGVACLHDTVSGKYFYNSVPSGVTAQPFGVGGKAELATDAYLESDGTQVVNTGYFNKPNSRVEVDFCLNVTSAQVRVFGTDSSASKSVQLLYIAGDGKYAFINNSSWTGQVGSGVKGDTVRHTAVIDRKTSAFVLKTGSAETYRKTFTTTHDNTSLHPMGVFGAVNSADASEVSAADRRAKMKLYSFRVYEDDVLVHEFLPYKNGAAVGLYDTQTGAVRTDVLKGNVLTVAGAGTDGSGGGFVEAPADTLVRVGKGATVKVYAPGAVSYRWTLDGEPVADASTDAVTIPWRKQKTASALAVTPVYQLNGTTFEGEPVTAKVEFAPLGLMILMR